LHQTQQWMDTYREANHQRVRRFKLLLGAGEGRTLVDLGCGPCIFAKIARDRGWKVTAVDARAEQVPGDIDGIDFVQADVREFDSSGFHTVANLGLLYHLPVADQEELLGRCVGSRVLLETQVHTPGVVPPPAEPWGHDIVTMQRPRRGGDYELVEKRKSSRDRPAYEGVIYPETHGAHEPNWRSSIGNTTSFWPTEPSLLRMIDRCGYRTVRVVEPPIYSTYGTRKYYVLDGPRDLQAAGLPLDP
jgi:Methyltransferase domain